MAITKHAVSIHQQGGSKELPDGIKTTDEDAAKVSLMILFDVLVGRFYSIGQYLGGKTVVSGSSDENKNSIRTPGGSLRTPKKKVRIHSSILMRKLLENECSRFL